MCPALKLELAMGLVAPLGPKARVCTGARVTFTSMTALLDSGLNSDACPAAAHCNCCGKVRFGSFVTVGPRASCTAGATASACTSAAEVALDAACCRAASVRPHTFLRSSRVGLCCLAAAAPRSRGGCGLEAQLVLMEARARAAGRPRGCSDGCSLSIRDGEFGQGECEPRTACGASLRMRVGECADGEGPPRSVCGAHGGGGELTARLPDFGESGATPRERKEARCCAGGECDKRCGERAVLPDARLPGADCWGAEEGA
mmetsp:Transcript_114151/g.243449  ORF Transcript_114151/g.243449 Transcript_114151/m.243449 type:complete len:260 (-) Transcript_114151:1393-2172(-)